MTIEVVSTELNNGIVSITAIDCSEENLQRMERMRDDGVEKILQFVFDTHSRNDYLYLSKWMKRQKATSEAKTWGEALNSINGIITTISRKYRVWD